MLEHFEPSAFLPRVRRFTGLVLDHFNRQNHAGLTHFRHMRVIRQMRRRAGHALREGLVALDHIVLLEDVQRGQGGRTRQRVAGVAVGMEEGAQGRVVVVEGAVNLVGGHTGRQGQVTAGQCLGQAQEVRGDTGLLTREHRPGATEAHRDFVVNQVHAITVTGFAQQFKVHRVVHAHAPRPLNQRLDNHGGHSGVVLGQGLLHGHEHHARVFFPAHAVRAQVAIGAGHFDRVEQQRLVGFSEQRHIAHRHRCHGLAVIAVGQGHEALFVRLTTVEPVVKAHFQRHFYAGRTVVGIKAAGQAVWRHLHQTLRQLDHRLMAEPGQNYVLQLIDLILDALVDARVGVPEHIDPPGTHSIQITLAFEVFEPHAFTALDRDQR